ncbi:hypothetical protein H1P_710016 [Hyella patelloides LEGE 07179]|uniref:Uncharacterized protein n=1 Tax=Hyella patelloides LEGE 07179 TaxID=945734 RepID=A0A563W3I3_9CYAN|nr:hypothetical protein H1P_710016 [Hyella patelloides LEGE 07179]
MQSQQGNILLEILAKRKSTNEQVLNSLEINNFLTKPILEQIRIRFL